MSVGDFSLLSWAPSVLLREYGYTAGETGALLGVIAIVTGMAGVLLGGALSDRLAVAGGAASRLRLPVIAALAAVIVTPFGFLAASGLHVLIAFGWWMLFSSAAGAAGIAAVQALVPSRLKGLSIALISFGNIFFGLGIGATSTAWLADQFFDGPGAVALAISSIVTPCAVIALLLFAGAFQSARRQPALAREA
jgi:MFS family permease